MALDFGNKVENGGIPPNGVLPASEFNQLVAQVNKNEEDIAAIDTPNSIESIGVTESQESGGNNVVTITETNGTETTFNVKNGIDGYGYSDVSTPTPVDGTAIITLTNGDTISIDLKHIHDVLIATGEVDRIKFHVCKDETEYTGISTKDANTLYLIPESSS